MKFGLMFFAASEDSLGQDKYRLVVDSARFGDAEGFSSVWVPERHFTAFGGLYPNPAVLHAGLATCTTRIRLNAGSVVAPLHHPLRIAEEWSVVDNLSNGRVGLSFASGWNPNDFVFAPERYATEHEHVFDTMQTVQRLWRGETFTGTNGVGQAATVAIFPKPVQPELPVWLTVAGNPAHFERAGSSGANLLTHLLDQDEAVLASRIALYRSARAAAGFDPATGIVSLMIHTFVGSDAATVREQARRPYCNYIKANIGLFKGLAQSRGRDADLSSMSPAALDEFVNFLYDRFAAERGLIGTPESCAPLAARLEQVGVSELACLLDFGPEVDLILSNLPHLARLKHLHESTTRTVAVESNPLFDRAAVQRRCVTVMTGDEFHRALAGHGIQIAGAFQPATSIWRGEREALAQLVLATSANGYHVHPASLDACGRILAAALPDLGRPGAASYVPTGFAACDVFAPLAGTVWVHASLSNRPDAASSVVGDISVYDESGRVLARLAGLSLKPVEQKAGSIALEHLVYERKWQPAAITPGTSDARGRWLLIADEQGIAAALAKELEASGGECVATAGESALRGIVYLRGLDSITGKDADTATLDLDVEQAVRGALVVAQSSGSTPVWIVTRGAVSVRDSNEEIQVSQAPLWGFGRALAVERPGALGGLIDLDSAAPAEEAARELLHTLTSEPGEDMMAFRSAVAYVPRLGVADPIAGPSAVKFTSDETVLVTGGVGGLGLRLIDWLITRGARRLLLCSRRAPGASAETELQRLRASGIDIVTFQADVHDYNALRQQMDALGTPVTSGFHLAGMLDDGQLGDQTWDRFVSVFAPKVGGAWNLHLLTRQSALKHFVLFSSVSSLVPAPGQSNYAAANAFLDGLAHHRRANGLPATVINWGPWSEAGHAETSYGRDAHARLASLGIGAIAPATGLKVLETLLQGERTQTVAVSVDWAQLFRADPAAARLGLLADLVAQTRTQPASAKREPSALIDALTALPREERRPYLLQFLSDMVIAALKLRTDEPIDARQRLFDVGLDSIMALELKDRLEGALAIELSATLLFVRPTLDALADYILTDIVPDTQAASVASPSMSEEELTQLLLREIDASRGA